MMSSNKSRKPDTVLTHGGRDPAAHHGIVNPPIYRASTVLFPSVEVLRRGEADPFSTMRYGRYGTPTHWSLEQAVAELEGGYRSVTTSSGLGAITTALGAFVSAGDHLLIQNSVYEPTRVYADRVLARMGVRAEYFDPGIGAGIADLVRPQTRVLMLEAPGSLSFEMPDVPLLVSSAKARSDRLIAMIDNTWPTPLYFQPLKHGVDLSIHAATKYIVGHSDAMLGLIVATEETFLPLKSHAAMIGQCASPDDAWLGQRGLRSMSARLKQHQAGALHLAEWLKARPEIAKVMHPALPEDPGHAIWKRDFCGACGLFGFVLKTDNDAAVTALLEGLSLFGMGYSWGGYESLLLAYQWKPYHPDWLKGEGGTLMRIHVGLEDTDDLIADLEAGFERLKAAIS